MSGNTRGPCQGHPYSGKEINACRIQGPSSASLQSLQGESQAQGGPPRPPSQIPKGMPCRSPPWALSQPPPQPPACRGWVVRSGIGAPACNRGHTSGRAHHPDTAPPCPHAQPMHGGCGEMPGWSRPGRRPHSPRIPDQHTAFIPWGEAASGAGWRGQPAGKQLKFSWALGVHPVSVPPASYSPHRPGCEHLPGQELAEAQLGVRFADTFTWEWG